MNWVIVEANFAILKYNKLPIIIKSYSWLIDFGKYFTQFGILKLFYTFWSI